MATDADQLHYLARMGHFGHDALLAPDTFVQTTAPTLGIQVAKNDQGYFSDKLKVDITPEPASLPESTTSSPNIRTRAQADLNERLMQQGVPLAEIAAREAAAKGK